MREIIKPSTLPGFGELLPKDQILFNRLLEIIRKNYEFHGFYPLDTPVLEKTEVLLAKGGGETAAQVYSFTKGSTEMSMRFDLTVPLARYVAEHISDLAFPFKRYQIGKVYRGERAQRGRFREFYQCDIDVIGNEKLSLVNDAEMPVIIAKIFREMGFEDFKICVNNRKILTGFYRSLGVCDATSVLRIVDKLDKIGIYKVKELLEDEGLKADQIEKISDFLKIKGNREEILLALEGLGIEDEDFKLGVDELSKLTSYMEDFGIERKNYKIDLKIARGLDYYTGSVYETFLDAYPELGSVCSGGRYDDLAANYTKAKLPGVGISIGLSRLFFQLTEKKLIESKNQSMVDVLVIPMDDCIEEGIKLIKKLRDREISTSIYTEAGKMGKKFKYADDLEIPYVIVLGKDEIEKGIYGLKDMKEGNQENLDFESLCKKLSSLAGV